MPTARRDAAGPGAGGGQDRRARTGRDRPAAGRCPVHARRRAERRHPAPDAARHAGMEPRPAHRAGAGPAAQAVGVLRRVHPRPRWRRSARDPPLARTRTAGPAGQAGGQVAGGHREDGRRDPLPAAGDGPAVRHARTSTRQAKPLQLAAAHCAYFLDFAVAHNPERATGVVIEQPKLLDREHDNLRAALRWSCAHDPETALRLAASLWRFWFLRGHAVEGARWVERALAVAPEPTRPRAAALIGLTGLDSRQGRGDRHRALGAEALAIMRQIGEPDEVVMARIIEATLAWSTFDLDDAEQMAAEVRAEAIERGRPEHAAAGSWLLGQCALFREDGPLAAGRFDTCLSELAQSDPGTRPFLPVITPSLQLVPIAGRLVPCVEETMLLGRRVGVIQATGYVLSAIGYAARLSGGPAVGDLRHRRCGRAVHRAGGRPGPGAGPAPARLHPPRLRQLPGGRRGAVPGPGAPARTRRPAGRAADRDQHRPAARHGRRHRPRPGDRAALPVRVRVGRRPGGDGRHADHPRRASNWSPGRSGRRGRCTRGRRKGSLRGGDTRAGCG